jgi:hypothetical protein
VLIQREVRDLQLRPLALVHDHHGMVDGSALRISREDDDRVEEEQPLTLRVHPPPLVVGLLVPLAALDPVVMEGSHLDGDHAVRRPDVLAGDDPQPLPDVRPEAREVELRRPNIASRSRPRRSDFWSAELTSPAR